MNDTELRLECIRIAIQTAGIQPGGVIAFADGLFKFLSGRNHFERRRGKQTRSASPRRRFSGGPRGG